MPTLFQPKRHDEHGGWRSGGGVSVRGDGHHGVLQRIMAYLPPPRARPSCLAPIWGTFHIGEHTFVQSARRLYGPQAIDFFGLEKHASAQPWWCSVQELERNGAERTQDGEALAQAARRYEGVRCRSEHDLEARTALLGHVWAAPL
eukprot:1854463-Rhodomonas_salina.3